MRFVVPLLLAACSASTNPPAQDLSQVAVPSDLAQAPADLLPPPPDLAPAPIGATVVLKDDFYMPNMVQISVGQRVKWSWQAAGAHGVDSVDNAFPDGPILMSGGATSYEYTFTKAGTYPVQCLVHGAAMPLTIVVK